METVTLYRATGPLEFEQLRQAGFRRWPVRLPEHPIFYPMASEAAATRIAREWNYPESGTGYVARFQVRKDYLDRHPPRHVRRGNGQEWWLPAEQIEELNANMVGLIEVIHEVRS